MAWIAWEKLTLPKGMGGLGVRDIQAFNEAFLAKISVRLMEKPDGLLGRTLLPKYCPDGNLLTCTASSSASHGWNSILAGRDLLNKKMGWVIGTGTDVMIWEDPWLSLESPLRPMGPATWATASLVVKDLIQPGTGGWNRTVIQAILPFDEERILELQPSIKGAADALRWLGTKDGVYSVKSGYHAAMAEVADEILEDEATPEFDWKKTVWNLKLAPKVKMFTWKSLKGILPVGETLVARHINVDPRCKRCGGSESINHLLFHCPFAREVWNHSPLAGSFDISGLTDLRADWAELHSLGCLPPTGLISTPLVPWIFWSLWKARNKWVFEKFAGNPADVLSQAITAAKEWEGAQVQVEKRLLVRPLEPTARTVSVAQSDAAWSSATHNAGLSWIVTNPEQSSSGKRGISFIPSPLVAEGLALRDAVAACQAQGRRSIRFESDSAQLIKAINRREVPLELYGIVEDILHMSLGFESAVFRWISRLKNVNADVIAKNALALFEQEVVVELIPPPN